jgi:hypothetical protein
MIRKPWFDPVFVLLCAAILAGALLGVHWIKYPHFEGWFAGADPGRQLASARAWAAGDLVPARHYYPDAYALVGALFDTVTPAQPFLVPTLVYLLAFFWLFQLLAVRLASELPHVRAVAALCCLVTMFAGRDTLAAWIMPWSTTLGAPLVVGTLLATLRFADRPGRGRALLVGLAGAAVGLARPTDGILLLAITGVACLAAMLRARLALREIASAAVAGSAGVLAVVLAAVALHLSVHGWQSGEYLDVSRRIGFEWRLIPLRWVVLAIDARPLFPGGAGMALTYPWVLPGIAGMVLCLRRPGHGLVAAAIVANWLLYLSYRDLPATSLWRYSQFHYFKWTQPFLLFYACLLLQALADRRRRALAALAAIVVIAVLLPWQARVQRVATPVEASAGGQTAELLQGISTVEDAIYLPASGSWEELYFPYHLLRQGGRDFRNTFDWKATPLASGILMMPLRLLPPGPAALTLLGPASLSPDGSPLHATVRIRPGIPCALWPRAACDPSAVWLQP